MFNCHLFKTEAYQHFHPITDDNTTSYRWSHSPKTLNLSAWAINLSNSVYINYCVYSINVSVYKILDLFMKYIHMFIEQTLVLEKWTHLYNMWDVLPYSLTKMCKTDHITACWHPEVRYSPKDITDMFKQ